MIRLHIKQSLNLKNQNLPTKRQYFELRQIINKLKLYLNYIIYIYLYILSNNKYFKLNIYLI